MMKTLLILCLLSPPVLAEKVFGDLIQGLSTGISKVAVANNLTNDENGKKTLEFVPNNPLQFNLNVITKYGTLGLFTDIKDSEDPESPKSPFQSFYYKNQFGSFDFRYSYANFKGAAVDAQGKKVFYSQYQHRNNKIEISYYTDKNYLKLIQLDLKEETNISNISPRNAISFLFGLSYERTKVQYPNLFDPTHQSLLDSNNIKVPKTIFGTSLGALAGLDALYRFKGNFFIRGKLSAGIAYRVKNEITLQSQQVDINRIESLIDLDFTLGYLFARNQHLVLNLDIYSTNTYGSGVRFGDTANFLSLLYSYYF